MTVTADTSTQKTSRENLIRKFTSRKFLMALAGLIIGTAGMIGFRTEVAGTIIFGIVDIVSILGYILAEGTVDAASIKAIIDVAEDTANKVKDALENTNAYTKTVDEAADDGSAEPDDQTAEEVQEPSE